jgi:hypothetical protein
MQSQDTAFRVGVSSGLGAITVGFSLATPFSSRFLPHPPVRLASALSRVPGGYAGIRCEPSELLENLAAIVSRPRADLRALNDTAGPPREGGGPATVRCASLAGATACLDGLTSAQRALGQTALLDELLAKGKLHAWRDGEQIGIALEIDAKTETDRFLRRENTLTRVRNELPPSRLAPVDQFTAAGGVAVHQMAGHRGRRDVEGPSLVANILFVPVGVGRRDEQ